MSITTVQRAGARANGSTIENRAAASSTTLMRKPEVKVRQLQVDLKSVSREKSVAYADAIVDAKKSVDRAIAASQQVNKGAGVELTGTERANFESLRAVAEITRARTETLMKFNEKHHIFPNEDLAKTQSGSVSIEELRRKVEQSNASESEKRELMAALQELDKEYKRLCKGFESKAKELGIKVVYLPLDKFGDTISQIQSSDFRNMSYEELVKKYPELMGNFKKRLEEILEEERKLKKKQGRLALDDAKRDPGLREEYTNQMLNELLSDNRYADLRKYASRLQYDPYRQMGPLTHKTPPGMRPPMTIDSLIFTDPSINNDNDFKAMLRHELEHAKRVYEGQDNIANRAFEEHIANEAALDYVKENGGNSPSFVQETQNRAQVGAAQLGWLRRQ